MKVLYAVQKNSMHDLREVLGGGDKNIYCQWTVWQTVFTEPLNTKVSLAKVRNQETPLKYSEKKSYILYQFRADVQALSHRPRYKADDPAETDVCAKKCQVPDASTIREITSSSESTFHRHLQR